MWHLYLLPIIGDGTKSDPRRPKYITTLNIDWEMRDYGFQPVALVAADVDDTTDVNLQLNADVIKIPDNLDMSIGDAALAIVQNALETRHLPAQWVTSTTTYRELLRTLLGFFAFLQRYAFISNSTSLVLGGAMTLNTRLNQLSTTIRNFLVDTATSLQLNISTLSGATTIRTALKVIADQWGQRPTQIGGISI